MLHTYSIADVLIYASESVTKVLKGELVGVFVVDVNWS